jgi:PAS domain S-box-containing protein
MKEKDKKKASETEILNLIEAFKYFEKTTSALNKAYHKLEIKIDDLRSELEEKNRLLSGSVAEIARMKTFLSLILENMSSGVVAVDSVGKITIFNKIAGVITGYNPEEVLNKEYSEVFNEPEKPELTVIHTLKTEKPLYRKEKLIATKNGEFKPIVFSSSVILDENEELLGAVEIFEDVSEIKKLQEEVRRHHTLAELGEMAANIAHEIRNPLGGIGGFATLLERDLEGDSEKQKMLKRIIEGINELNKITSDVLMYTRQMEPRYQNLDIKNLLLDTILLIKMEAEDKNIRVDYHYPKENIEVSADVDLIKRMALNLMKNALQAMPKGGELKVDLS